MFQGSILLIFHSRDTFKKDCFFWVGGVLICEFSLACLLRRLQTAWICHMKSKFVL